MTRHRFSNMAAIVVCRMDSTRLPGKVLAPVGGRTLLDAVLERCRPVADRGAGLIVATTARAVDDPIAHHAREAGALVHRGSCDDVAGRLLGAARDHGAEWFARVNADSPFLEPALLAEAFERAATGDHDFITNLAPRSFPYGVSVEVVRVSLFEEFYQQLSGGPGREHPTRVLYESLNALRYYNISRRGRDLSHVRLTVDTPEDLERVRQIAKRLGDHWLTASYPAVAELYEERASR